MEINSTFDKYNYFYKQIGESGIQKESISKFYRAVGNKIRKKIHAR